MEQEKSDVPLVDHETYPKPTGLDVGYNNEFLCFVIYIGTDSLLLVFLCRN